MHYARAVAPIHHREHAAENGSSSSLAVLALHLSHKLNADQCLERMTVINSRVLTWFAMWSVSGPPIQSSITRWTDVPSS